MPRQRRHILAGHYYHVVNRASVRARLFYSAADYRAFVGLLAETVDRYDLPLLSYCAMPNHWHLIVRPVSASQLSTSMHWLTTTHAIRWCGCHKRRGPGPLYQGRYKAIRVQPDIHLLRACRYVERNALKAKLTDLSESWPWGSAFQRCRNRESPRLLPLPFLTPQSWLRCLNESPDDAGFARAIRRGKAFGDDEWVAEQRVEPA